MISIKALGQAPVQQQYTTQIPGPIQPQPITRIPGAAYAGLQVFWDRIRQECEQRFSPSQCQALLGVRPTMLEPSRPREGLPWYMSLGIGIVIGKVIL